jgi:hypothetical protein
MHAVDITNYLDERISELVKNRLPEEPVYPSGESQYASFMIPRDEMSLNDKSPEKPSIGSSRLNGIRFGEDKLKDNQIPSSKKYGLAISQS